MTRELDRAMISGTLAETPNRGSGHRAELSLSWGTRMGDAR